MSARDERGFTLIEILAVVAILALVAAFVVPNLGGLRVRALRAEAQQLAAQLELARQRAIVTGVPHRLWLELDQRSTGSSGSPRIPRTAELAAERAGARPATATPRSRSSAPPAPRARLPPDPGQLRQPPGGRRAVLLRGGRDAAGPDRRAARSSVEFARDGTADYTEIYLAGRARAITSRSTSSRSTSACGSAMTCRASFAQRAEGERRPAGWASRCSR